MKRFSDSRVALSDAERSALYAAMVCYMVAVDSDFTTDREFSDAVSEAEMDLCFYPILPAEPISDTTVSVWYDALNYFMDITARTPAAVALSDDLWACLGRM